MTLCTWTPSPIPPRKETQWGVGSQRVGLRGCCLRPDRCRSCLSGQDPAAGGLRDVGPSGSPQGILGLPGTSGSQARADFVPLGTFGHGLLSILLIQRTFRIQCTNTKYIPFLVNSIYSELTRVRILSAGFSECLYRQLTGKRGLF